MIDDICIVTRALKPSDIATNSRVNILSISSKVIKAQLLDESNRIVLIPKIRFKFKLDYGEWRIISDDEMSIPIKTCILHDLQQITK